MKLGPCNTGGLELLEETPIVSNVYVPRSILTTLWYQESFLANNYFE